MNIPPSPFAINREHEARVSRGWQSVLCRDAWPWLCTLTYRELITGAEKVHRDLSQWACDAVRLEAAAQGLVELVPVERKDAYGHVLSTGIRHEGRRAREVRSRHAVYIAGIEWQRRGSLHVHAVLKPPGWLPSISARSLYSAWYMPDAVWETANGRDLAITDDERGRKRKKQTRGFARCEQPRDQRDVCGYVSKYILKGGEIVISQSFRAVSLPRALMPNAQQL